MFKQTFDLSTSVGRYCTSAWVVDFKRKNIESPDQEPYISFRIPVDILFRLKGKLFIIQKFVRRLQKFYRPVGILIGCRTI
jgi:hypothetical protein